MSTSEVTRLHWWERVGVIHAHPLNVISHLICIPLLAYLLWQHNLLLAILLGFLPTMVTVLFAYFRWTDKPSLSRIEQFLYERSTRLNLTLTVIGVFLFSYGAWMRSVPFVAGVMVMISLLTIFGVTKNVPKPQG